MVSSFSEHLKKNGMQRAGMLPYKRLKNKESFCWIIDPAGSVFKLPALTRATTGIAKPRRVFVTLRPGTSYDRVSRAAA
jgi:hypothetical protein